MARFHSQSAADAAETEFNNRFRAGAMPSDIPEMTVEAPEGEIRLAALLKNAGLVPSASEANRNIDQGGVKVNGEKITDRQTAVKAGETIVVQVGKRKWAKITVA